MSKINRFMAIAAALVLGGCAAQAAQDATYQKAPAYGPQFKVSVFVRGLDDTATSTLVGTMINDDACDRLRIIERADRFSELSCDTTFGADRVANAFQSVGQSMGIGLSVSHAGDHVFLRKLN